MTFEAGQQLLHYRLIEKIGEGGMGVVWKAEDTTLGRPVAIKILPEQLSADTVGLARFEREAKLLASLNHPNIATIHGLHEADGRRFLAMELIDGRDLSQLLEAGALSVDETLRIATRVAEALETAHDNGIVHRDLKPANIALTADGSVKVLDFGLAKALEQERAESGDPEMSPTITSAATQAGMIMGTAGYMSPEQARGQEVDARADVWALGCVIYEMLTAERAYGGKTISDTLAAVLRAEPEWEQLPASVPAGLKRVVRRCLVKEARDRLRHAGDVRIELAELSSKDETGTELISGRPAWALPAAAIALIALLLAAWGWLRPAPAPAAQQPVKFEIVAGSAERPIQPVSVTVSPDGRRFAWVQQDNERRSIWMREIDALEPVELPDTEGALHPSFSPDGRSLAFYAGGKLRRIDLGGRVAVDLCDAADGSGISWTTDGRIVFNPNWIAPLSIVSAEGGEPVEVTRLDPEDGEIGHWFPRLLPDNEHVLVSRWRTQLNDTSVGVTSIVTGETRDLIPRATDASYVAGSGQLLFTRAGAVHAVPFDADRLEISGEPELLLDGVGQSWGSGHSSWAVSNNGVLAYMPGGLWSAKRRIVRVARDGTIEPLNVEPAAYLGVQISPGGGSLALTEFRSGEANVVVRDLERGTDRRFPTGSVNTWVMWGPDDRELLFTTARKGPWDIYRAALDQGSEPEMLVEGTPDQIGMTWSRDGRYLIYQDGYRNLAARDLQEGGDVTEFADAKIAIFGQEGLELSADSRWLAYTGNVSGRSEILLRRFPAGVRSWQVSVGGGIGPQWSADGSELFYRRGDAVLAVPVRTEGDSAVVGKPRELFRGNFVDEAGPTDWDYDATTDSFVLMLQGEGEFPEDRFSVWFGWMGAQR
jgi:Tol biopolymer transport system component/tRNA A-37 threonylcarbamoyl transferase component Bud32